MHWLIPLALCFFAQMFYPRFPYTILCHVVIIIGYGMIWSILQLCKKLDSLIEVLKSSQASETTKNDLPQE